VALGYGGEVLRVAKEGDIGVFVNKLVFSCFLLYRFCYCFLSVLPSWRRAIWGGSVVACSGFFLSPFLGVLASCETGLWWRSRLDILLRSGRAPRRRSIFDAKILPSLASG
jgi:hypothetical protein